MTIRLKILVFQLTLAATLFGAAGVTLFSIDRIDYYFDRNRLAGAQLDTVIRLSAAMNRYSENVAELLLLGRTELDDFAEARESLEFSFARLEDLIRSELDFVRSAAERSTEQEELVRLEAMKTLYEDIDFRTQRLLFLRDQGRLDEAITIFREDIEERLDAELETLVAAAIADEEAELEEISAETNRLEAQLYWLVAGVSLAALVIASAAGWLLTRSLTRPVEALTDATRAMGEGDLSYRIAYGGRDEFADLAAQFDLAAGRLQAQREALLEVQAGLETEVARRTGELEEANQRLQRLDQMRMLFLADIGHELRTPLTVLRGEAEVALRGTRTIEDHRETLQRIVQLTQQMGRLVEDLLFLARAEVGAIRFEMQSLDARDVLEIVVSEAQVLGQPSAIEIDSRLPDRGCSVLGDAERLTQAFLIVLDNAVKYSDPATTVSVVLRCEESQAVLQVRNTGPEIPAADLPFVLNRFYRGRQSGGSAVEGSGLGLSIAKWIVDTHGGRIDVASANRSTAVTIHLPRAA